MDLENLRDLSDLAASAGDDDVEVRRVVPSRASKTYICPGCQQEVVPGTGHVVVVPRQAPDLRRHWHTPCWLMRDRRHPGR